MMTEATVTIGGDDNDKKVAHQEDEKGMMEGFADRMNGALMGFYFKLGFSIGSRPRSWALGTLILCLLLTTGIFMPGLKNENRGEKLWVPSDTQAQADKRFVDTYYGSEARFGEVIIKATGGGNVLEPTVFAGLATLVAGIEATSIVYEGTDITWDDQCYKIGPTCSINHPLKAFAAPADYDTKAEILDKLNTQPAPVDLATGRPMFLDSVIGGVTKDATGRITGASAVRIGFLTKLHEEIVDGDSVDLRGDAYEQALLDLFNKGVPGLDMSFVVARSFGDEFGNAIGSDLTLLQVAFILILSFAALMLSKWDEGCVGSRVSVTLAGIVAIGMSISSSYGLCSFLGLFYSPLMNVLPFLLLGVGVDDMFVIVNSYDLVDKSLDLPTKIGKTLATAGASITVTSLTDIFAFVIGSNTTLPALRNFCFYASFGILFVFIYQVSWFVAWLTIDEWRRAASKSDCLCCMTVPANACCACCNAKPDGKTRMGAFMGDTLGGMLSKKPVKIAVIVLFAAVAGGGFAGCAKMEINADVNNFIPPGSYLKTWIADSNTMFRALGDSIAVYSRNTEVNSAEGAAVLAASSAAFKADPYIAPTSVRSWIDDFNAYRNSTGAFDHASLYAWTNSDAGSSYRGDIVWRNDTNNVPDEGVISTRMRGNHVKSDRSDDKVKSMDSLRGNLKGVSDNGDGAVFAYSSAWLNFEQYKAIKVEAVRNISSTMAVMVVIIALLIVTPSAVLVVCFCLCLIIVNIIGYMHFWGLTMDSVTIIMLVIALGLAVDYSAHIGRAYMEMQGTPDERLRGCLANMGVAVLNGALSTFVAVLLLGGSQSYVFVTFFRQLFLCIVFGLGHGLILLPVLMSLAAPKPYSEGAQY